MGYLVLTELFLPTKGGTAIWFDEVYRRIGGATTHIVTASVPDDEHHDREHPNHIHRLKLRHWKWMRPASGGIYLKFLFRGLILGLRYQFDAVHAGRVLPEGYIGWFVARLTGKPLVIYAHGEEITAWRRSSRRLRAMRFAYCRADHVIANSRFTQSELIGLGVSPARVSIVYPGVNLDRFHPNHKYDDLKRRLHLQDGQRLILSVGRLTRRKGFDQVIRSLSHLLHSGLDVHHAIIGIGEDFDYLRNLAASEGVSDRVHLLGHVEPEELPRWYCAADVFAMPNREIDGDTEGFGMVYIEAAACGTPSVTGLKGGTGDAVIHEKTGLRIDGASVDAVATALRRMLGDATIRSQLGKAALERAHGTFGWDTVAKRTLILTGALSSEDPN